MNGYGDFAFFYDSFTENVEYKKRAEYIYSLLTENNVGKGILLDLACGTGSLSFLLEEKGFDVIGVDASEEMLSVAQEKKCEKGSDIIFLLQKMENLDLFGTIDAAVCTLDSINHISSEQGVKKALRNVALFMNDGGIFIFDVNTPYKHKEILGNNTFIYDTDDAYCVWQNTYNEKDGSVDICLDIFDYDKDEDVYIRTGEEFTEKCYDLEDLKAWAKEVKFEVLGVYEEFTKEEVKENTQRAVFVLKKHGTQFTDSEV